MPTSATSFATGLVLCSASFSLGTIFANWPYDYFTLWVSNPSAAAFENSLQHYRTWGAMPVFLQHFHHGVMAIGLTGLFIKLYRPSESNTLFDGGSLFLYVIAIVFYIINLRKGIEASTTGLWGEVTPELGINVIASSQVFIVLVLIGVFCLQIGQYWAEREDQQLQEIEDEETETNEKEAKPVKATKATKGSKSSKKKQA